MDQKRTIARKGEAKVKNFSLLTASCGIEPVS
jgi:hypothetical protein